MSKVAKLEIATNIAILTVSVLLTTILIRDRWSVSSAVPSDSMVSDGDAISLPGIDWSAAQATIVLALSTTCPYCAASTPFYRQLAEKGAALGTPIIVTMDEPESAARQYLQRFNVPLDVVVRADLASLRIPRVPMLLVVNSSGVVSKTWQGVLTPEQEAEVFALTGHKVARR